MPLKIRIKNLNKKRKIDRIAVKAAVLRVLSGFRKSDCVIDITFVDTRRIKALNKKYMKRKGPTDVLSFSLAGKPALIGDIYISSDEAKHNAKRFNTYFRKEILLYAIHGVLHALGFGDKSAGEKKKIRRLESKFLKEIERV